MAAQRLGIEWGRSSVTALEAGVRELTASELLALPSIMLAALIAKHPDDWQQWEDEVQLAAFIKLDSSETLELSGSLQLPHMVLAGWFDKKHKLVRPQPIVVGSALHVAGEAERKLARKLGIDPNTVVTAAVKRWGRSLTEERDARVSALVDDDTPPRTVQARRGRVTRELLKELNLKPKGK